MFFLNSRQLETMPQFAPRAQRLLPSLLLLVIVWVLCSHVLNHHGGQDVGNSISFTAMSQSAEQRVPSRWIGRGSSAAARSGPRLGPRTERGSAAATVSAVLEHGDVRANDIPSVGAMAAYGIASLAVAGGLTGAAWGTKVAVQAFTGLAGLYFIMSLNEYIVHRYYQHLGINTTAMYRWLRRKFGLVSLRSSGHMEHHKETLDDMTLDIRSHPILDNDPYRGTAFSWVISATMTVEIAIQSYPWLWLCGWTFRASTVALLSAMALHAMVWQTLHPNMHELPDPLLSYGVPGWSMKWLRNTGYFKFLYQNHEGHHRIPGAHGNYNVCCPLVDYLFGTYVGVIPPNEAAAV